MNFETCSLTEAKDAYIYVIKITIIGSDNGLFPSWHQAIIWTNYGILLIRSLGTNSCDILIRIDSFSLSKMRLKKSSGKWWTFCLGLNVLRHDWRPVTDFERRTGSSANGRKLVFNRHVWTFTGPQVCQRSVECQEHKNWTTEGQGHTLVSRPHWNIWARKWCHISWQNIWY